MPKLKSHSGCKKRFKKSSTGKIRFKKAGTRHLLTGMTKKRGRQLRKKKSLNKADSYIINQLLPNS